MMLGPNWRHIRWSHWLPSQLLFLKPILIKNNNNNNNEVQLHSGEFRWIYKSRLLVNCFCSSWMINFIDNIVKNSKPWPLILTSPGKESTYPCITKPKGIEKLNNVAIDGSVGATSKNSEVCLQKVKENFYRFFYCWKCTLKKNRLRNCSQIVSLSF